MAGLWFLMSIFVRLCLLAFGIYLGVTSESVQSLQFTNAILIILLAGINH